jgi:hypothetical protein
MHAYQRLIFDQQQNYFRFFEGHAGKSLPEEARLWLNA